MTGPERHTSRTTKSVVKTEEIIKRVEKEKGKINKIQPDKL